MEKGKRPKRLDEGRIDADKVIDELMESVDLKQGEQEETESECRFLLNPDSFDLTQHFQTRNATFLYSSLQPLDFNSTLARMRVNLRLTNGRLGKTTKKWSSTAAGDSIVMVINS